MVNRGTTAAVALHRAKFNLIGTVVHFLEKNPISKAMSDGPRSPPVALLMPTQLLGAVAELFGQREIRVVHGGSTLRALVPITLYSAIQVSRIEMRRIIFID